MFNTNWPLQSAASHGTSASNVDWSALAESWMQQREFIDQQSQWQHAAAAAAPPPPPPPPPPPQFLLGVPPIPPPGPPPIGMTFPPLPPSQVGLGAHHHHHQLQVGSNTTQESLTMTNIENPAWRSSLMIPPVPTGPDWNNANPSQWRPNKSNTQPLFPVQPEMTPVVAPSFGGRNYWPPVASGHQAPPPVPPPPVPNSLPLPPPLPPQQQQYNAVPPQFQPPPPDKRTLNTSFNTSIPSLMDLPSSYGQASGAASLPPIPVPPVPMLPVESTSIIPSGSTPAAAAAAAAAKRRKIPAWLREELGRIEKEKMKKMQNISSTSSTNRTSNDISSKFDDDEEDDENNENEHEEFQPQRTFNESIASLNDYDDEENEGEDDEDERTSSSLVASTPIVVRRSRFDDDKPNDTLLNVSAISKRQTSPSPSTTLADDDNPIEKQEQFMIKLRRALTELLLEVTNEELASLAKEVFLSCKAESSTPVIRKSDGLSSLIQNFSGTDSDDETPSTVISQTSISKSPVRTIAKPEEVSTKKLDNGDRSSTTSKKKKKSMHNERSPSSSSSRDRKSKKHHHKKHRRSSSSTSSTSSHSRKKKSKKNSTHNQWIEHDKSKKYDDRGRKR